MMYQFYRELIAGAERRASSLGYYILLIGNPEAGNLFDATLDMLDTRRVDALVTFGVELCERLSARHGWGWSSELAAEVVVLFE